MYGTIDPLTKKCLCDKDYYDIPASPYLCAWPAYLAFRTNTTQDNYEEDLSVAEMLNQISLKEEVMNMLKREPEGYNFFRGILKYIALAITFISTSGILIVIFAKNVTELPITNMCKLSFRLLCCGYCCCCICSKLCWLCCKRRK